MITYIYAKGKEVKMKLNAICNHQKNLHNHQEYLKYELWLYYGTFCDFSTDCHG